MMLGSVISILLWHYWQGAQGGTIHHIGHWANHYRFFLIFPTQEYVPPSEQLHQLTMVSAIILWLPQGHTPGKKSIQQSINTSLKLYNEGYMCHFHYSHFQNLESNHAMFQLKISNAVQKHQVFEKSVQRHQVFWNIQAFELFSVGIPQETVQNH